MSIAQKENQKTGAVLDAKLLAYAAVAGGALGLAQPANAEIIYSGIKNLTLADNATVAVDLDGGGEADFKFINIIGSRTSKNIYHHSLTTSTVVHTHKFTSNYINPLSNQVGMKILIGGGLRLNAGTEIGTNLFWGKPDPWLSLKYSNFKSGSQTDGDTYGYFFGSKGYLGVRFQLDGLPRYGWIQYQGTDASDNVTKLFGTIIDWAYETVPYTPITAGQKPCIDNDGDGYGVGDGCLGPDSNDNNPDVYDNSTCAVVLTPGRVSKVLSLIRPVTGIIIRGDENASFTGNTEISWGTATVKTLFQLPFGKKTLLAIVRVQGLLQQPGDVYHVTVGNCTGQLNVTTL